MGWQEKIQPAADPSGYAEFDDFDPSNYDPPDIGKGETYISDDKILRMKDGSMFVGQTDYNKRPNGHGHLMLADGSQHIGYFEEGRAMGAGLAQIGNGTCVEGEWRDNRRYGSFQLVDAKGVKWIEKYDVEGKKVARKKVKLSVPNPEFVEGGEAPVSIGVPEDPGDPALECWTCQGLFHKLYNNDYACRKHKGRWIQDKRYHGGGEAPGVWNCCANENRHDPGCVFLKHKLDHGDGDA